MDELRKHEGLPLGKGSDTIFLSPGVLITAIQVGDMTDMGRNGTRAGGAGEGKA